MRPVVIAANWKMNTTPADAGELARTIAGRTRVQGVIRVICPPFVCLARRPRRARRGRSGVSRVGAQDVHHELAGAVHRRHLARRCSTGLATWVIVGHSERRRDHGETDERIGAEARPRGRAPASARSCASASSSRTATRAARSTSSTPSSAARSPATIRHALADGRARHRLRAGLGDRHRPQRARLRRRGDGRGDPVEPRRASAGSRPRARSRSSTAAASPRRTSASSSPSRRSTARSSAAPRSSPTRWPGSSAGPA